ncbi:hypothetical protein ElyMa_002966400 [Elysia marginata]|uniref:CCHC-type domain-containing protein n=1 Tax=Elysia marginata TaxID=1093978 RepID=A0AAV4IBQ4_9GAST|nr:hypothetical protein ElyMa_002966400 [Elysia marginata]
MERKPKRCADLIVLAQQCVEAHGESSNFSKGLMEKKYKAPKKVKETRESTNNLVCYTCGKKWHLTKDCREKILTNTAPPPRCDYCKKLHHTKETSWKRQKSAAAVATDLKKEKTIQMYIWNADIPSSRCPTSVHFD